MYSPRVRTVLTAFVLTAFVVLPLLTASVMAQAVEDFDLYLFDVPSRSVFPMTSIPGAGEFNPSFAPSGNHVVHDVVTTDPFSHDLYITEVETGTSVPLPGGENGNDADWSPDGSLIAFDNVLGGNLFTVPAEGGPPTLLREDALDPSWSPLGDRLAFVDRTDGTIRTIGLDGLGETVVATGDQPAWAPTGDAIAYRDAGNIFTIPVDAAGNPTGPPVQQTFDEEVDNGQPTWSKNSKRLVFQSNRGGGTARLWATRSTPSPERRLPTGTERLEADADFSPNGRQIVYTAAEEVATEAPRARASMKASSYPNPFNPSTSITFALPETMHTRVAVYDLMGREVALLAEGPLDAGDHTFTWNATNLSTGTYLYRIATNTHQVVGRLVLIK